LINFRLKIQVIPYLSHAVNALNILRTFGILLTVHLNILILILTNLMHQIFNEFISCLYMFRAHVLIVRRPKLYYTTSGIITMKQLGIQFSASSWLILR